MIVQMNILIYRIYKQITIRYRLVYAQNKQKNSKLSGLKKNLILLKKSIDK